MCSMCAETVFGDSTSRAAIGGWAWWCSRSVEKLEAAQVSRAGTACGGDGFDLLGAPCRSADR
jgi:hypothetical protein